MQYPKLGGEGRPKHRVAPARAGAGFFGELADVEFQEQRRGPRIVAHGFVADEPCSTTIEGLQPGKEVTQPCRLSRHESL